jgi:hypothetical protein
MVPFTVSVPPGADDGPVRTVDLVEGREAVILLAGADQAEIERVRPGAAQLKRAGSEHEAVDDTARTERQHVAGAAAAEFDRGKSGGGIDRTGIENSAIAVDDDARPVGADTDRPRVDDVIGS